MARKFTKYPSNYVKATTGGRGIKYVRISSPDSNPVIYDGSGSVCYRSQGLRISKIWEDPYGVNVTVSLGDGLYADYHYRDYSIEELAQCSTGSQLLPTWPNPEMLGDGGFIYHSRDKGRTAAELKDNKSGQSIRQFINSAIIDMGDKLLDYTT